MRKGTKVKKLLIALEGLPGGGKTTIAQQLAEDFQGTYIQEIIVNSVATPDDEEYYIESELQKLSQFNESHTMYNFIDRSFYSMLAYQYGRKMVGLSHMTDLVQLHINAAQEPDWFIYLKIDDIRLCNKRKQRSTMEADVWTRDDSLIHIQNFYESFFMNKPHKTVIATDSLPLEEVYALITKELTDRVETKA